ncbi:ribosome biogenesis protein Tsr1 [Schizosaccharomyces pombe]|uniref:Ribosome biogenesis protein tsr1 n=1 Tax=Schizosaccharomyces pombe (strain 972 / ATCC 24843) TaxID=284812 RepID=TSR1_SCHPO|nr:putative ribosome biogenesis protein Tsr1 [Schizosaccharomyces pombe]O13956.1 RecName: Full=Ribosome biogenesis protein tsr1 [Schizosaccharomyces pombe 972h-]CAB11669.1 ribosome biogenesis protein Tsr1 (predicted) [Schizosaccharomyces pombe]|eukprot:NP_593391.1 putative ribosome biogenesis protein Tsr1 [Schizosaccharomyces pombe]
MAHHHRSTFKAKKPFKSKHASKSSLKEKYKNEVEPHRSGPKNIVHTSTKADRRNTAKQIQLNKRTEVAMNNRIFGGKNGAPKVITIVPLCNNVDSWNVLTNLLRSIDPEASLPKFDKDSISYSTTIDRFKQNLLFLLPKREFYSLIDACKVSDYVIFVLSAVQEVDEFGELIVRTTQGQGISSVLSMVHDLSEVDSLKTRNEVKKSLQSFMNFFFSDQERVFAADVSQDALNVMRALCTSHPRGIHWRDSRSYLLSQEISYSNGNLLVRGIVRGKGLDPNRLIHIQGFGDFAINRIYEAPQGIQNSRGISMDEDTNLTGGLVELCSPTQEQDSLESLGPIIDDMDTDMDSEVGKEASRGVRLDDFYYFDDEEEPVAVAKRVPKGTSTYQATWIPDEDEESDQYSDVEDTEVIIEDQDNQEISNHVAEEKIDSDEEETIDDAKSEMFVDLSEEEEVRQYEEYRKKQKELQEELEFPDEVELQPNELARERFKKYRGLRSLYTSQWDADEYDPNEPREWRQLFKFENYRNLKNKFLKQPFIGEAKPGKAVYVELRNVPIEIFEYYNKPWNLLVLYSLLQYENKLTVSQFTAMQHSEYEEPIESKEELLLQIGPRRFMVRPLYSDPTASGASNNLQKYHRYLPPKQAVIASVISPIVFGNVPIIMFKKSSDNSLRLAATGSYVNCDTNSVIAKRAVLTGHPFKVHKKLVTIRYMFFNPEDVIWFKPIQLFTKQGRTGYIKEPLGTHGYFKATFNGKITVQDTVAMSLYKRMYPLPCELFKVTDIDS